MLSREILTYCADPGQEFGERLPLELVHWELVHDMRIEIWSTFWKGFLFGLSYVGLCLGGVSWGACFEKIVRFLFQEKKTND